MTDWLPNLLFYLAGLATGLAAGVHLLGRRDEERMDRLIQAMNERAQRSLERDLALTIGSPPDLAPLTESDLKKAEALCAPGTLVSFDEYLARSVGPRMKLKEDDDDEA